MPDQPCCPSHAEAEQALRVIVRIYNLQAAAANRTDHLVEFDLLPPNVRRLLVRLYVELTQVARTHFEAGVAIGKTLAALVPTGGPTPKGTPIKLARMTPVYTARSQN